MFINRTLHRLLGEINSDVLSIVESDNPDPDVISFLGSARSCSKGGIYCGGGGRACGDGKRSIKEQSQ